MSAQNLFEKVWDAHAVGELQNGQTQLFVGRHLIHEVTSPQAFGMLRERNLPVRFPERTFATVDHIVPTNETQEPYSDPLADAMIKGKPINVFNDGNMARDFTYIDDIVDGVVRVLDKPATPDAKFDALRPDPATSTAPYRVFNIGNGNPTPLMDYIGALETALGVTARKNFMPMQLGDVPATSADTSELGKWVGFQPDTPVVDGVQKFADWYLAYYQKND